MKNVPYTQEKKGEKIIREFSTSLNPEALVWHRDSSDRIIRVIEGSGWMLQVDNSIPVYLIEGLSYTVFRDEWHRLLRGDERLVIEIEEY